MQVNQQGFGEANKETLWSWSLRRKNENGNMKTSITLSDTPGGSKGKCNKWLSYKEALTGKLETVQKGNPICQFPEDSDGEDHSLNVEPKEIPSHHSKFRLVDTNEGFRRESSPRPVISIPSSSSQSVPSSPSPPERSRWSYPRLESVRQRPAFHGPGHSRGGWYRHFQHHFPPSSVFSAPHGARTERNNHGWRGNINHHARQRPSLRTRFYDSSSEVFQNYTVSRKVFQRPRSHRGEIKSEDNPDKHQEKSPTPIVSIKTAFNLENEMGKNPPKKSEVSRFFCFPTCTGRKESTVHFFPDRFSMPSYSFDMIFYQKLAFVLGSKGKTIFSLSKKFQKVWKVR